MDAALQALATVPLARPQRATAAQHLHLLSTLCLVAVGLADWALPQWAQAEAAAGSACCGGGSSGSKQKGVKGSHGKSGSGGTSSSGAGAGAANAALPEPPTHAALLASLHAIPASARALSAALEEHRGVLEKPEERRSEEEFEAAMHFSWAAKACVRLGYILRSRACTGLSVGQDVDVSCAWRTKEEPEGSSDAALVLAGTAAAEALVRFGGRLAQHGSVVPPRDEAAAWAELPTKALHYAAHLLEATIRRVRMDELAATPAMQRAALGLALSTAKAAMVLAPPPGAGPAWQQRRHGTTAPPALDLLCSLLSAVCFDTFFVLAPSAGLDGSEEDDETPMFASSAEAM